MKQKLQFDRCVDFFKHFLKEQIKNLIFFSTRVNDLRNKNLQSQSTNGQHVTGSPHIHDPSSLRHTIDDQYNAINERQNIFNEQNLVNDHHNYVKDCHASINGTSINNHKTLSKINNGFARNQVKNTEQLDLNNDLVNNKSEKTSDRSNHKQNGHPIKNHQSNVDHKNGINRLANENVSDQEQLQNMATNLRQLLRPTVIEKPQERVKTEYDTEDINGPYNFRQLLRPTEYLPTESLRKRKGGIVSNGVPLPKEKIPEKHVKRRAPLAPTQNKLTNAKK